MGSITPAGRFHLRGATVQAPAISKEERNRKQNRRAFAFLLRLPRRSFPPECRLTCTNTNCGASMKNAPLVVPVIRDFPDELLGYPAGPFSGIVPRPSAVAPSTFRAFVPVLGAAGSFLQGPWTRDDPGCAPLFVLGAWKALNYRTVASASDLSGHPADVKPTPASRNRPIRSRMAANSFRGTATSASGNTTRWA